MPFMIMPEISCGVPPLSIRGGRSTPFRSALIPNIHYSRSLLIDRCAGVLFPAALTPGAGYKVFLRVQSERSGGVPPAWADGKIVYNK